MGIGRSARRIGTMVLGLFAASAPPAPPALPQTAPQTTAQTARTPARPTASAPVAGVAVATLAWSDRPVERAESPAKDAWRRMSDGDRVRTGDSLRTSPDGVAGLDFPWMAVTLGSSSVLSIPASAVLSTVLERGRAEFSGQGRDIVKIQVGRSEIRGGGRLVLRHEGGRTAATALAGAFRVAAAGKTVEIKAGEGTVVRDDGPPADAFPLPPAPKGLVPGSDPVYVVPGRPRELQWAPAGGSYHVELLGMQSDEVFLSRDVAAPPLRIEIPWLGAYRWRVSARGADGVESRPSADGYVCVVEK